MSGLQSLKLLTTEAKTANQTFDCVDSKMRPGNDRRPLRFWQPFNDWWRSELERLGRRPNAQEILVWYDGNARDLWQEEAPTLQETRVHAKCLRSLPLVRDYFRNYRAKKRTCSSSQLPEDIKEEDEEIGDTDKPRSMSESQLNMDVQGFRPATSHVRPQNNGVDCVHAGLPVLHPQAAALWSQALDPSSSEALRTLTLSQLQHAAAVQQQITLAAIAQQFAVSRAAHPSALETNERQGQSHSSVPCKQEAYDDQDDFSSQPDSGDPGSKGFERGSFPNSDMDQQMPDRADLLRMSHEDLADKVVQLHHALVEKCERVIQREAELRNLYGLLHQREEKLRQTMNRNHKVQQVLCALRELGHLECLDDEETDSDVEEDCLGQRRLGGKSPEVEIMQE